MKRTAGSRVGSVFGVVDRMDVQSLHNRSIDSKVSTYSACLLIREKRRATLCVQPASQPLRTVVLVANYEPTHSLKERVYVWMVDCKAEGGSRTGILYLKFKKKKLHLLASVRGLLYYVLRAGMETDPT